MFSFDKPNPAEHNVELGDMEEKYPFNYLIVISSHLEDGYPHGDVIAILTPEEYCSLKKLYPMTPKYGVWEGLSLKTEGVGAFFNTEVSTLKKGLSR